MNLHHQRIVNKPKMINKTLLVRHEFFGPLLFSEKLEQYFIPKSKNEEIIFSKALNEKKVGKDWKIGLNSNLKTELEKIGLDGKIREINSETQNKLSAPLEYYFDYTNKCNLSCPHCYNKNHLGKNTMSQELVKDVISEMYDLGVMRIHLAGGEPTIDKKGLKNYLESTNSKGIVTSMATNGTLLSPDICDIISDYDLFAVSISIDGPNEESNSKRRGDGNLEKAIEGVKRILKYRDLKKNHTEICLKPTYTPNENEQKLESLVKLSIDLSVDKIKFANPERSLNHEKGHYGKNKEGHYKKAKFIESLVKKYGKLIKITNITNPTILCSDIGLPNSYGCIGGQELLTINPDGRITPCLMNSTLLGNYHEWGSIKKFWNESKLLKNYIENLSSDECNDCNIYSSCRGGCQVRKIVEYGSIKGKDPLCPNEHYKKDIKTKSMNEEFKLFKPILVFHSL